MLTQEFHPKGARVRSGSAELWPGLPWRAGAELGVCPGPYHQTCAPCPRRAPTVLKETEKSADLRLTVPRASWKPAASEPQPRASQSLASAGPNRAPGLGPPRVPSASQQDFHSPTLRLRPSSSVWYTQLGVKAAALLRTRETRATSTAVATSF